MERPSLRFQVPESIGSLAFADLPQSPELSEELERLHVQCLGDLKNIALPGPRRASKADKALILEVGCLLRRAKRGEFGKRSGEGLCQRDWGHLWRTSPGHVPGETIDIPEAASGVPLAVFEMPPRLRNILQVLDLKHAGDLNGREYQQFLRAPGMGAKMLQALRKVVQQIREAPGGTCEPIPEKKSRVPPCFVVPEAVRDVIPYDFPITPRLDGVLRRMGIARLGDLHGMEFCEMSLLAACGPATLKEALRLIEHLQQSRAGTTRPGND
jgi:hypothetical protein